MGCDFGEKLAGMSAVEHSAELFVQSMGQLYLMVWYTVNVVVKDKIGIWRYGKEEGYFDRRKKCQYHYRC